MYTCIINEQCVHINRAKKSLLNVVYVRSITQFITVLKLYETTSIGQLSQQDNIHSYTDNAFGTMDKADVIRTCQKLQVATS